MYICVCMIAVQLLVYLSKPCISSQREALILSKEGMCQCNDIYKMLQSHSRISHAHVLPNEMLKLLLKIFSKNKL